MKYILVWLMFVTSVCYAEPGWPWVYISGIPGMSSYVAPAMTTRNGAIATQPSMTSIYKREATMPFASAVVVTEYDCTAVTYRITRVIRFADVDGRGQIVSDDIITPSWLPVDLKNPVVKRDQYMACLKN